MIVGLAVLSALVFGAGVALQQRAALTEPSRLAARPSLLLRLARRPLWLFGLLADVIGFGLQALALRRGSLVVVQPLITLSLLFTLLFIAVLDRVPLTVPQLSAVTAVLIGLGTFLAVAHPTERGSATADSEGWLLLALAVSVVIGGGVLGGLRRRGLYRAAAFGLAAGTADAFMAVLAKAFAGSFHGDMLHPLATWTPYALVVAGLGALLMTSTAYQAGEATVTLPIITVSDPLFGCIIGVVLFGERVHLDGWRGPVVVVALVILVVGLVQLGRDRRLAARAAGLEEARS